MSSAQLLLIKKEVTYGVDPVAAAVDTVWGENVSFTPQGSRAAATVERPGVGPVAGFMTGVYGELSVQIPLAPSGTKGTAPKWGYLLKACGWTETIVATTSVTYGLAADPSASDSLTVYWREDRRLHKLTGARGVTSFKFDENQRPVAVIKLKGLKTPVADGAKPVHADATWTGWSDLRPITQSTTTFTFAGASAPFRSLSIDSSDNVVFSDRPNQRTIDLVGARTLTGKAKMGVLLPSVLNLETLAENNTISTLALVHGATAGSILTVNARFQNGQPTYSDDKGLDVQECDLTLNASALNVDDDFSIVLT